jgi:IPT/TIG domain
MRCHARLGFARGGVWWGVTITAALLAACGGGPEALQPASLDMVASTDAQTAAAGAALPQPLAVIALASAGEAVTRVGVRWTVTQGDGALLSDTVTLTDGNGRAQVALTLGPATGEYRVRAALRDNADVAQVFRATATAGPTLITVTPSTFTGGDTVTLAGTGLAVAADVDMGDAAAAVVSGSSSELTVVAPVCLPPGTLQVRVRVAGAPSNTVTATYQASGAPIALAVGEYASIDPSQLDAGCATFADAGPDGAEYLVTPQSTVTVSGVLAPYRLRGNAAAPTPPTPPVVAAELPLATRFHDLLRAQEQAASLLPHTPMGAEALAAAAAQATSKVSVGDRRSFQVCTHLPCSAATDFSKVDAQARYVGTHAAIFMDTQAPAGFSSADYDSLGTVFDDHLYDIDTRTFGAESDIDHNGVVIIVFSAAVNKLTPKDECSRSVITGYFFGIDIDPLFQSDARSNRGEAFYALTPDPNGTVTCALSTEQVFRLVPVTFIHEFQHMISYYQHVLVRGSSAETLWLNEGMSHLAEELGASYFEDQGNSTQFSNFAIGDLYDSYIYLRQTGSQFLEGLLGHGSLEERGAAWLFLRWLVDQYGVEVTRQLEETSRSGADNVSAAVGAPFSQLVSQWFLANYVSDLPNFGAPARLRYTSWRFRTTYQSLYEQLPSHFPDPFPINPLEVDGAGLSASGTLHAGSGDYYLLTQAPNEPGFTLTMDDGSGGPVLAAAVARLNVIRLR